MTAASPPTTDPASSSGRLTKSFPVFDCDAHINDPLAIWRDYVAEADREAVRRFYWQDERQTVVNNRSLVMGGQSHYFRPLYNPIHMAGPQMSKPIIRKLLTDVVLGRLGPEEMEQVEHDGAVDPHARLVDMDLMGIDQVMIIPTMMVMHVPFGEDPEGARGFARAYNEWARDFCAPQPDRLFPAAWLPLQSPTYTVREIHERAAQGFKLGLVRPIDARHAYPNRIGTGGLMGGVGGGDTFDDVYRAFEETGMVVGMHTFPPPSTAEYYDGERPPYVVSPGEFANDATDPVRGQRVEGQALSFVFEASTWLVQVLLSGFLDRYPKLKMAILESNSSWLRSVLAHCDRLFTLHRRERRTAASRLPSEAFAEQCFIAFESDERPTFRQWRFYEDTAIWSSDAYHTDGADVWSAIREMQDAGVPEAVQAKFLGANARRAYGLDPVTYVSEEAAPIDRPAWFPQGEELARFAKLMRDPRTNAAEIGALLMGNGGNGGHGGAGADSAAAGPVQAGVLAMVVVDADSHVWEPGAIWSEYLSAGERVLAEDAFFHDEGPAGTEVTVVNGQRVRNLNRSVLNRHAVWRPGMTLDDVATLDPHAPAAIVAGARDPLARLEDLDAMGVDHQIVFPTLFTEHLPVVASPVAATALARAYNDWIADFCSAAPDRLHPVGVLPLQSVPASLRELERLADKGFRAVLVRPCAHQGRYLHFSEFGPLWALLQETGVVACLHPSAGTTNPEFTSHGLFVDRVAANLGIGHDVAPAIAPIQDNMFAVLSLLYYGHLEDFPGVRLAFCHAGASWLELALEKAETYLWLFPGPITVSLEPEELWFERPTLVTFDAWEESVAELHDVYSRAVAWGSRYPHHDAHTPAEARALLEGAGVPEPEIAAMLGGNAADRFALPVEAVQHVP